MKVDLSPVRTADADPVSLGSAPFVALVEWANSTRLRARLMAQVDFPLPGDISAFLVVNQLTYRGATRPGLLAERLESGASNISKCVRRLTDAGLVCRVPDPDDERAVLVALTADGRAVGRRILGALADDYSAALADWSDTEMAVLHAVLTKLADSLGPLIAAEIGVDAAAVDTDLSA